MTPPPAWSEPRTAIVTGAGRGIGLAIAQRWPRKAPLSVAGTWRALTRPPRRSTGGGRAFGYDVDVSDRDAIDAAATNLRAEAGPITILVNNAGLTPFKSFRKVTRDDLEKVFEVNVFGIFDCCQAVVADMVDAGGGGSSTSRPRARRRAASGRPTTPPARGR